MADSMKRGYKKNKYCQDNKKRKLHSLEAGARGFLCTCNFQEKNCISEACNILTEYADRLLGPPPEIEDEDDSEEPLDLSDLLKQQISDIKKGSTRERRFQSLVTSVTNCVFIQSDIEDPVKLCHSIVEDIHATKRQKTRFLLRLVPVEVSCSIKLNEITEAANKLFDKYFTGEPTTFCVVFNRRYSNCPRDVVIQELANLVVAKNAAHKVDLQNPNLFIIVEIIKGLCLMSVVADYYKYRKYNLSEICANRPAASNSNAETAAAATASASDVPLDCTTQSKDEEAS